MTRPTAETVIGFCLVLYLFVVGTAAAAAVIINFPTVEGDRVVFPRTEGDSPVFSPFVTLSTAEQALLLLAFTAGVTGSFLHAAQSLASYLGNSAFKRSWTAWYFLRPWVGGVLGVSIYFALRAGLMGGGGSANPYGVAAVGLLGGWFSKTTTDKLQEVFETLFKTDADRKRKDKLTPDGGGQP